MGGALEKAAKKVFFRTCGCLSDGHQQLNQTHVSCSSTTASSPPECLTKKAPSCKNISSETESQANSSITPSSSSTNKNLCTICLDPLIYSPKTSPARAIFTAQCSHAFHFACISSNVHHGSITCPICRARWSQLPRSLKPRQSLPDHPALQILDNSIATSRLHRRSFHDDDDSVEPAPSGRDQLPRLTFSLLSASDSHYHRRHGMTSLNSATSPATYLNVRLSRQPPIDLVLIASPNGPHLRLMKQAMALVVFSLRPIDRLAVVTHSSSATRVFPLRRMSSYGKRTALRVVDRLFYSGHAESVEVLKKGVKILQDRAHKNPQSCIFHLTGSHSSSYYDPFDAEVVPFRVHRFDVSFTLAMHEFEDFLARALGGGVRNVWLRVGDAARFFAIGELRGGEERSFPLVVSRHEGAEQPGIRVEYSYLDDGRVSKGEVFVGFEDKGDGDDDVIRGGGHAAIDGGSRMSTAECTNWDYHDALMARRWAKHLHGGYSRR